MTRKIIKGVLKTWKEDRGFGFITPENSGRDIFIHISALKGISRRPEIGDVIYYQVIKDSRGKFKAINAQIEGVSIIEDKAEGEGQNAAVSKKTIILAVVSIVLIVAAAAVYFLLNHADV